MIFFHQKNDEFNFFFGIVGVLKLLERFSVWFICEKEEDQGTTKNSKKTQIFGFVFCVKGALIK